MADLYPITRKLSTSLVPKPYHDTILVYNYKGLKKVRNIPVIGNEYTCCGVAIGCFRIKGTKSFKYNK